MARRKTYTTPPKDPLNQWVRDAIDHAFDHQGRDYTYEEIADELNRARLGRTYDKSMAQKMTTIRGVKLPEMNVISKLTGFPLPAEYAGAASLDDRLEKLPERRRQMVLDYLADQEALHSQEKRPPAPRDAAEDP